MSGLRMKYFVLNPNKNDKYGYASRSAMLAYATAIEPAEPDLAADLRAWVDSLMNENSADDGKQGKN